MIKSGKRGRAMQVARMGEMINAVNLVVTFEGKKHLKNIGVDGRIILRWILNKFKFRMWTEFMWLRIFTIGGLL
jgi:hypothetical protein